MKKIVYLSIGLFVLSACTDILDEIPKSIASETFYNTAGEVEVGLNGIYYPLHGSELVSLFTQLTPLADYAYGKGSIAALNEYNGYSTSTVSNMNRVWQALYLSIRNANIVISKIPESSELTQEQKDHYLAEARFMRAFAYFYLVRLWAGVPIRTVENMSMQDLPRSSVDEVYSLIVDDLTFAEQYLGDTPRLLGTPSKWTAKTVLADVYLNIGNWEQAMNKSEEVITSGVYSLVQIEQPDDYEKIYGADLLTSPEEVFYFKYNDVSGWALMNFFHISGSGYKPYGANWYAFYTKEDNRFYADWDDEDYRKRHNFYKWEFGYGDNTLLFKKYIDPNGTTGASNDWPIYRFAEVFFIYSEAANSFHGEPTEKAVEYLNKVHRRAYGYPTEGPSPVDFKKEDFTKETFFDLVLREKGYETVLECKRWFELVRTGTAKDLIRKNLGKELDETMLLFPIPVTETNYNKAINPVTDQNPGY